MQGNVEKEVLLYDPIFAKKPPEGWEDSEKGGFFGKAATKKAIFIIFLVLAISFSLLLSFRSLSKKKYSYDEAENGYRLGEFNGTDRDNILRIDAVVGKDGAADPEKKVTAVRNYAVCCNETLDFIFIGKDVTDLEYNCFYYCTRLKAVFVDADNPAYVSVDGVLYRKDMTEIILHPIKNSEYRAALALGLTAPADEAGCGPFLEEMRRMFPENEEAVSERVGKAMAETGAVYTVPATVTDVAPFCFNYCDKLTNVDLPEGLKTVGQMAFFKCKTLESIRLPDGLESIGADGLSYCEKLDYIFVPASVKTIGHHAFYGCLGVDAIYLGAADESMVSVGESWLPKQSERSLKNVAAVYGAERRDG
ncbi:MAG: leucine-rich repeat domain-containing protein [Clostridia bacterium]|nr:leucine-rich repeat domain-containing protein [Clostridia bacterium]